MSKLSTKVGYLVIIAVNLLIPLYVYEAVLSFEKYWNLKGTGQRIMEAALKEGVRWDRRPKIEVVRDLKAQGKDAFPTFTPQLLVPTDGMQTLGGHLFPLTGPSRVTDVFCNENGEWTVYESDEHGFNNPPGQWKPHSVDVVFIGDSFVHGACLRAGQDFAGQMRHRGLRALNIGIGGTGPLIYLANLREYARPMRPKIVLFVFYAVDIRDHVYEYTSPMLRRYVEEPAYSQDLIDRQPQLDSLMRGYLSGEYARLENMWALKRRIVQLQETVKLIARAFTLDLVRERIRCRGRCNNVREGNEAQKIDLLKRILGAAQRDVASWGGHLVFAYLPDWYYYAKDYDSFGIRIDSNFLLRQDVLRTVTDLGIPLLDVQRTVFDASGDPLSLFNYRMYGHYNLAGYSAVSAEFARYLCGPARLACKPAPGAVGRTADAGKSGTGDSPDRTRDTAARGAKR